MIQEPCLLYAHKYTVDNVSGFMVYRSVVVKDTDNLYRPVLDLLNEHTPRLIIKSDFDDETMMFGRAELAVYRCANAWEPAPELLQRALKLGGFI